MDGSVTISLRNFVGEEIINQVCFVESSFGQKVWSTFPVAQYRIASPYQNGAIVVCLRKTNTNSFILSRAL
jgi:hypothetical protein